MLTIDEIKSHQDKMYSHGQLVRESSSTQLVFYWKTHWDASTLQNSDLGYKGEFDIMRKSGRQILGDMATNDIQVNFEPADDSDNNGADIIDGLYRKSSRSNRAIESRKTAKQEAVVCGVGGWELVTRYETDRTGNKNQIIDRNPLNEFNNNVLWDEGAKLMDKADAMRCSILVPMSKEGMEKIAEELTGVAMPGDIANFGTPEHSYTFPWIAGKSDIFYIARFYQISKTTDHVITMVSPEGDEIVVLESQIDGIDDDLEANGYEVTDSRKIERNKVTLYIVNGFRILKTYDIVGPNIPVVPIYGERQYIEGEELYEGMTRLAMDPQRLRDFQMSYLFDIVSRSPRSKPIFFPEQISAHRSMYEIAGTENNLPYLLMDPITVNGVQLPPGPIGVLPEQKVPDALMQSIALSREAVNDVASASIPKDFAEIDLSGEAIKELQARIGEQSIVYQENYKHGERRDAEIFAGMAPFVYDSGRTVSTILPDGTIKKVELMSNIIDEETGNVRVINDLTGSSFDVYADIGRSFKNKRDENYKKLGEMAVQSAPLDPQLSRLLILKQAQLIDGVYMDDIRDWSRKQSILAGFMEPETDEEKAMLQESQQGQQQPDANAMLAQAEQAKADASMADVQRKAQLDQFNAKNNMLKTHVNQFDAETRRLAVQIDAQEANASIEFKRIDELTKRMDAINKINKNQLRASVN